MSLNAVVVAFLAGMTAACAPTGYHYGSWSDGPAAAFSLSPNAPAQGFTENGRPVTPTATDSPARTAIQKYCATASAAACSLYVGKVGQCPKLAANGYSILLYERTMERHGTSQKDSAALAVQTFTRAGQIGADDAAIIASRAIGFVDAPEVFQSQLMTECIATADASR